MTLKSHPIAEVFPLLKGEELDQLVKSVADSGLRHPVLLYEGMILDGRNRYVACQQLGVEPEYITFEGTWDEAARLVMDDNVIRRHLTTSQRAQAAVKLANLKPGRPTKEETGQPCPVSLAEAAQTAHVSRRTVVAAARVEKEGVPELIEAVQRGEVTVNTAVELTHLPKEEQQEIVKAGPEQAKKTAAELRQSPIRRAPTTEEQVQRMRQSKVDNFYLRLGKTVKEAQDVVAMMTGDTRITLTDDQRKIGLELARGLGSVATFLASFVRGGGTVSDGAQAFLRQQDQA